MPRPVSPPGGGTTGIGGYDWSQPWITDSERGFLNDLANSLACAKWGVMCNENASDKERRQQEYLDYKDFQRQGYARDEDPCKDLKNKIQYHKELNRRRAAWDKNWPHEKYPGGRHADDIARDAANIARWESEYRDMCKCE